MGFFIKTIKNVLFITFPALLVFLLVLEMIFRIVIQASDPPLYIYNETDNFYCFSNDKEEGVFTIGRFSEIKSKWRINNMGWNYPIDYHPVNGKKLIAVIGDSYIEAFQVSVGENYPYLLREKLMKGDYEVYAVGISDAPLSEYLHFSRYINKHFKPDILIFNIVHNDFDESIYNLFPDRPHFLQVSINKDGSILETTPRENEGSRRYMLWKRFIRKSATFRYFYYNLKIRDIMEIFKRKNLREKYEANIRIAHIKMNKNSIFKATNYIVKTIKKENIDKRIIFILDAPRDAIYHNLLNKSNVSWMNVMMKTICDNNNIEFIDLAPLMDHDYKVNNKKFNSEIDNHWNEYGHAFVANVLYDYLLNNN